MPRTAPAPNIPAIPGMNPGAFVMGGGGSGGGGSGKGGDGAGGEQGANGQDGGDGANGGGNGSGKCGHGANGSCTNCSSDFAAGDPVAVMSGQAYTVPKTDLFLPGAFNLDFRRSYSTDRKDRDLGMGYGWVHSLAWSLVERRRSLVLQVGDGTTVELPLLRVGQEVRNDGWIVKRQRAGYKIRPANDFVHYFAKTDKSDVYRLVHVSCRGRGRISLYYNNGLLIEAVDSVGRSIHFGLDRSGRITKIVVPSSTGQSITFASYEYDDRGDLRVARDADGHRTEYTYDDDHRLTQLRFPSGLVFHYRYDESGRCFETWGAYPGGQDPALDPSVPAVLADGSPAKGILHSRLTYGEDYAEYVNSIALQRFFRGADGKVGKAVDATGGVTTRIYDGRGRVIALTDPNGETWETVYDQHGAVIEERDPLGGSVRFERDAVGRVLAVEDELGHRTQIERDGYGEEVGVVLATGAAQRFTLGPYARMQKRVDAGGGVHQYTYDTHANMTSYVTPSGQTYRFQYDYWGRLLSETNPLGHTYSYGYNNRGFITSYSGPLGRTTTLAYDGMQNLVRRTNPDGTVQKWDFGGLDWLHTKTLADGSTLSIRYNREGWPLVVANERGERHTFEYLPNGLLSAENDVLGRTIRYSRDVFGRLVGYEEAGDKVEIVRDAIGQMVAKIAADGSEQHLEYSARGELVRATNGPVEYRWKHDPLGNVVEERLTVDGQSYAVHTERDALSARVASRTSLEHEVRTPRTVDGQVREVTTASDRLLTIDRDAQGLPIKHTLPGGASIVDTFDAGLRLKRRQIVLPTDGHPGDQPEWVGRDGSGRDKMFDYSPAGELVNIEASDGQVTRLSYDSRRRLISSDGSLGERRFAIDACGNYHDTSTPDAQTSYGAGNQLRGQGNTKYRYDDHGQLIEKRVGGAAGEPGTTHYEWDPWGMLSAVVTPDETRTEFLYDAFARRVAKRVSKKGELHSSQHFVWDQVSMVHAVDVNASGAARAWTSFLYLESGDDTPVGHRRSDAPEGASWNYYVPGPTLAPETIVDQNGALLGRYESNVFGKLSLVEGSVDTPFRHPGQQADDETGLHYNRYRYYDPDLGRYISPDPIGIEGGHNLYAYGPNPIGWVDPMGWKHYAQLVTNDPAFEGTHQKEDGLYVSGRSKKWKCPEVLKSDTKCHTEQKLAYDLIKQHGKNGAKGKKYTLLGEKPPCPRCHGAMMRASQHTGAEIEYKWKTTDADGNDHVQTMTYKGGPGGKPTIGSDGDSADQLKQDYKDIKLKPGWSESNLDASNKGQKSEDVWGVEPQKGSLESYRDASGDAKNADLKSASGKPRDMRKQERADYWNDDAGGDDDGDDL